MTTLLDSLSRLQNALLNGNEQDVRNAQTRLSLLLAPLNSDKPYDLSLVREANLKEPLGSLSPQESRIFGYLQIGLSNKQIAKKMNITPDTVKQYLSSVYRKYGVSGRAELRSRLMI